MEKNKTGAMMGNILVLLSQRQIHPSTCLYNTRLQVEENVGEDIHVHFRNLRQEFTKEEFKVYASAIKEAYDRILEHEREECLTN